MLGVSVNLDCGFHPVTHSWFSRYNHYVELVEPAGRRACIKCCDDPSDCPVNKGEIVSYRSDEHSDILPMFRYAGLPPGHKRELL